MYCHNCGTQIPDDARFCIQCGTKTHKDDTNTSISELEEISVADAAEAADGVDETLIDESPEDADSTEKNLTKAQEVQKQPLPAKTRWIIFAAATIIALAVGFISPAVTVFTHEDSVLSGKLNTASLDEDDSVKTSSATNSLIDADNVSSADEEGSSASSSASSNTSGSSSSSSSSKSAVIKDEDYLLPEISSHAYTTEELNTLSDYELYLARNEIFARYGRGFSNADLIDYFNSKKWYTQKYTPAEFDAMPSPLNSYEKENLDAIRALEAQRNSKYAV